MSSTIKTSSTQLVTDLLSHLVRFPTVTSDHATNRAALDWVEMQLAGLPLHITRLEHHGFPALIATTQMTKSPRLWLAGHLDVVPAKPSSFEPQIKHGRLYGRGAHDMKCGVAAFITLLQELGSDLPKYDLGLILTTDEEVGGYNGARWLLEQGYHGDAALIPDSGGSWEMEMGSKGVTWWELTATGQAAHASRPWDGVNAVDKIVEFINVIRQNLTNEPCGDKLHGHSTLNFATITGGTVANQVPDAATARVDVRISPGTSLETVQSWFDQASVAVSGVTFKSILADAPYRVTDETSLALFRRLAEEMTDHVIIPTVAHGSSDARHFAAYNIPTINVSPTGSGFHVPGEWVDIEDLGRYYEVCKQFVQEWCR